MGGDAIIGTGALAARDAESSIVGAIGAVLTGGISGTATMIADGEETAAGDALGSTLATRDVIASSFSIGIGSAAMTGDAIAAGDAATSTFGAGTVTGAAAAAAAGGCVKSAGEADGAGASERIWVPSDAVIGYRSSPDATAPVTKPASITAMPTDVNRARARRVSE